MKLDSGRGGFHEVGLSCQFIYPTFLAPHLILFHARDLVGAQELDEPKAPHPCFRLPGIWPFFYQEKTVVDGMIRACVLIICDGCVVCVLVGQGRLQDFISGGALLLLFKWEP